MAEAAHPICYKMVSSPMGIRIIERAVRWFIDILGAASQRNLRKQVQEHFSGCRLALWRPPRSLSGQVKTGQ
jgi:hypothetical protein